MDEKTLKAVVSALVSLCAIWGAILSTLLAGVKIWETFWKDRIRLTTTYSFSDEPSTDDTITVVNLSGVPIQVSHWTLAWKPNLFRWNTSTIDVTPEEGTGMFKIGPKDSHTISFNDLAKFDWSYRSAQHRQLLLTLHVFGRRSKVLKVRAGQ